jgi:hypothetical protein
MAGFVPAVSRHMAHSFPINGLARVGLPAWTNVADRARIHPGRS